MALRPAAAALVLALAPAALADEPAPGTARCGNLPPESAGPKAAAPDGDPAVAYLARSRAARTAEDRFALGLWCRTNGLHPEADAQFREAVRLDPAHAAAREACGDVRVEGRWVASEKSMEAKGLVRHEGRWILPEEKAILEAPAAERSRLRAEEDRARRLLETLASADPARARLARESFAGVDARARVAPLAFALRAREKEVRLFAAAELGRAGDRRGLRALVRRAVLDPDADVRAACVDAALAFRDPELLAPFARSFLASGSAEVRAAAADAMGRTGNPRGVALLVHALEAHGGGATGHIYAATQLSFVQDFDVEVAQTAFIADPIVGTLQEGAVLDVKVVGSEWYATRVERKAIGGALARLTGADHGDDAAAWKAWMRAHPEKLAAR